MSFPLWVVVMQIVFTELQLLFQRLCHKFTNLFLYYVWKIVEKTRIARLELACYTKNPEIFRR